MSFYEREKEVSLMFFKTRYKFCLKKNTYIIKIRKYRTHKNTIPLMPPFNKLQYNTNCIC